MRWLTFAALAWLVLFGLALPFAAAGNQTVGYPDFCTPSPCPPPVVDVNWRASFLFSGVVATRWWVS